MKSKAPCLNCADREPGCHGKCEKYGAYKFDRERELKLMEEGRNTDRPTWGAIKTCQYMKKINRREGK